MTWPRASAGAAGGDALKLRFIGTRGEIEERSAQHQSHSSLLVESDGEPVLVDCGADWLGQLGELGPAAVVVTHAHPDHAGGLKAGAPCPVYATAATFVRIKRFPLREAVTIREGQPFRVAGLEFLAFPVEHSLLAPAVGYRVEDGRDSFFYAPDLVSIPHLAEALRGLSLYIGDGASLARPILRTRDGQRIGHASIRQQLEWCGRAGVPRAIFTHCGRQIVCADETEVQRRVEDWAQLYGVRASIAYDGMSVEVRGGNIRKL